MLAALKGVLQECWRLGQVSHEDFYRAVDLSPVRGNGSRIPTILDSQQVKQLLKVCHADESIRGRRDEAILAVLYGGGLRRFELANLNLDDYQGDELRVFGKGRKWRIVYLHKEEVQRRVDAWIKERGSEAGVLFTPIHRSGRLMMRKMNTETIARVVSTRAREARIPHLAPHDLRRAMASELLNNGVDVFLVQRILGHASPNTTRTYDRRSHTATRDASSRLFRK